MNLASASGLTASPAHCSGMRPPGRSQSGALSWQGVGPAVWPAPLQGSDVNLASASGLTASPTNCSG